MGFEVDLAPPATGVGRHQPRTPYFDGISRKISSDQFVAHNQLIWLIIGANLVAPLDGISKVLDYIL